MNKDIIQTSCILLIYAKKLVCYMFMVCHRNYFIYVCKEAVLTQRNIILTGLLIFRFRFDYLPSSIQFWTELVDLDLYRHSVKTLDR